METYNTLAQFAQTWGLLYFVLLFAGIVAYALWPSNAKRFKDASQIPLDED
ncbi:MAG: cbb3-type cytochrome c oxidase subunit 3 [Pseudomonadota bacterium]